MYRSNDNWERLVAAVLRREKLWELFHAQSRSPSEASDASSHFRASSPLDNTSSGSPVAKSSNLVEDLFHDSARVLAKGTFGSVYNVMLENGTSVMVKRLKWFGIKERDFEQHMEAIRSVISHPNVDALRDYFSRDEERLIVYDHHSRGSVSELLHGKTGLHQAPVDWETRIRIAIGAARASNIFISSQRYGIVSEYGLANMIQTTFMPTARCYAPELKSTQSVSQASDVYSFGILLLELITRKSPVQCTNGHEAVDLVKLVTSVNRKEWKTKLLDRDVLLNSAIKEEIVSMLKIGLLCVEEFPEKRPKMSAVVQMMEDICAVSPVNENPIKWVFTKREKNKLVLFGYANHIFDLEDILRASAELNGKGTFGNSYKAMLDSGIVISVKRLRNVIVTSRKFQQHMEDTARMRHQNVVELKAYYNSKDEKLLVYDHYNQGSVSTMLHGYSCSSGINLDWETRLKVAVGAARGIAQIHTRNKGKLVHGNIRTSNIFLNEQQYGVVSDIGVASLMPPIECSVIWNEGDCAPEVKDTSKVSQLSDVYSFGIVLLELVTGKSSRCTRYSNPGIPLLKWVRNVVSTEWTTEAFAQELLSNKTDEDAIILVLQLAMDCVANVPEKRPKMADIVKRLEEISE